MSTTIRPKIDPAFKTSVAYFSMEYAIDQSLKFYSGGLGFLAGSYLRSAYKLNANLIGIGILWTYGYYDQSRGTDGLMEVNYIPKTYSFLEETGIRFVIKVHNKDVIVKALLLKPETFNTAPLYLMTTDIAENDYLSRTISHHLYDPDEAARIAQSILLGVGGAILLEKLNIAPSIYHLNEGHGLPLLFHLYSRFNNLAELKKKVVFTTHTPDRAGNEEHSLDLLDEMSFFSDLSLQQFRDLLENYTLSLNYTATAFRMAGKYNAVSKMHLEATKAIWQGVAGVENTISITNAQSKDFWTDDTLYRALLDANWPAFKERKGLLKRKLFETVADQCGKLFNENILTLVWARRFADYKRADLLLRDWERFTKIATSKKFPIQCIWAGKPYPSDQGSITLFNKILSLTAQLPNCATLTGYELNLSRLLKQGSDIWLNTPRLYHEASGTSGMTAAMSGSLNVSIPDGWIPEFARDRENCFVIPPAPAGLATSETDNADAKRLYEVLEESVKMYYSSASAWFSLLKQAAADILPYFDSDRMLREYYSQLYT